MQYVFSSTFSTYNFLFKLIVRSFREEQKKSSYLFIYDLMTFFSQCIGFFFHSQVEVIIVFFARPANKKRYTPFSNSFFHHFQIKTLVTFLLTSDIAIPIFQKAFSSGEHITDIYITETGTTELENLSHDIIDIFIIET